MKTKVCSCGKIFYKLPQFMQAWKEDSYVLGHSWECQGCGSTLFVKDEDVELYEREHNEEVKNQA